MGPADLTLVARHAVKLLVERRFAELEQATGGVRLSADDMEAAVEDMGVSLAMPPESEWRELRPRPVRNRPGAFELSIPLWTARGRTPHTVELTVHSANGRPVIEVDDLIVG